MIRYLLNKSLISMKHKYDYDVSYMQDVLNADLAAFIKFMAFQSMSSHQAKIPARIIFAARLRAIISEDCGPCTQLVVNMAMEANVAPEVVRGIINWDVNSLSNEIIMVMQFTELVLTHNPQADELREKVRALWGNEGLVSIAFAISSMRVYPSLKYTLGHGKACSKIRVDNVDLVPTKNLN